MGEEILILGYQVLVAGDNQQERVSLNGGNATNAGCTVRLKTRNGGPAPTT